MAETPTNDVNTTHQGVFYGSMDIKEQSAPLTNAVRVVWVANPHNHP